MSDPGDMLDYAGAANSAAYSLGKMKDSLAKIYRLLSSIQVLVCDVFHVFILLPSSFRAKVEVLAAVSPSSVTCCCV